ncbi:MAG: protein translocase subunit SecF [Gammaproteobacteria bacterium]
MDFFKHDLNIDFMGKWRYAVVISGVLLLVSVGSLLTRGLNLGIDFTGGTLIEVAYQQAVDLDNVRSLLSKSDYDQAQVQYFGTSRDLLIYLPPQEGMDSAKLSEAVFSKLRVSNPDIELRRVEYVGPQVGDELAIQGGLAMIYATFGILIYIMLRFHIRFAPGAVMALIHDVFITLGIFSVFQLEFDLTVLAAILAVMGYSLNDTIVVFDRIRENFRKIRKGAPQEIMNISVNQTLSRTVMTSSLTLLVVISLFIFGGEVIHNFSLALILGILVGTYSSIYVASPVSLALGVSKSDLAPVKKEGAERGGEGLS